MLYLDPEFIYRMPSTSCPSNLEFCPSYPISALQGISFIRDVYDIAAPSGPRRKKFRRMCQYWIFMKMRKVILAMRNIFLERHNAISVCSSLYKLLGISSWLSSWTLSPATSAKEEDRMTEGSGYVDMPNTVLLAILRQLSGGLRPISILLNGKSFNYKPTLYDKEESLPEMSEYSE